MHRKAITTPTTTHGVTAPLRGLYETRTGLFGRHLPLWEGGAPTQPGETPPQTPPPATPPASGDGTQTGTDALNRALAGLLTRHGSSDAVALHLLNENHTLREQRRTLQGQVPAAGSVVLTPEQAQAWQAYQELDADPAALRTRLEQGSQAAQREQTRELATVSGANPDVLSDLLRLTGLRAEVRDVAAEGTNPARREVRLLNAEGQDQGELRAYVQEHRAAYTTALFPASTPAQGATGTVLNGQAAGSATGAPSNPFQAALQGSNAAPREGQSVVSAFDFAPTPGGQA